MAGMLDAANQQSPGKPTDKATDEHPRTRDGLVPWWWPDPADPAIKRKTNVVGLVWDSYSNAGNPFWQVYGCRGGARKCMGAFQADQFEAAWRRLKEVQADNTKLSEGQEVVCGEDNVYRVTKCINNCKYAKGPKLLTEFAPYPGGRFEYKFNAFLYACEMLEGNHPELGLHKLNGDWKKVISPTCHGCRSRNKKTVWKQLTNEQLEKWQALQLRVIKRKEEPELPPLEAQPAEPPRSYSPPAGPMNNDEVLAALADCE